MRRFQAAPVVKRNGDSRLASTLRPAQFAKVQIRSLIFLDNFSPNFDTLGKILLFGESEGEQFEISTF